MSPLRAALAALACASVLLAHAQGTMSDADIRAVLQARVESSRAVGLVVGLVDAKGRRVIATGTLDGPGTPAIDADTLFEIGSLTKLCTTLLLADMVTRGEVNLDDPAAKFLPHGTKVPKLAGKDITLGQLASHASGLPRMPGNLRPADPENPFAGYTFANMMDGLAAIPDAATVPAEEKRYSNLGVALLGQALARKAGKDYDALLRERILEPLGMRDTRIALDAAALRRTATPHYATLARAPLWDLAAFDPAGALHASVNDLLVFAEASLGLRATPLAKAIALQQKPIDTGHALGWHTRGYWFLHSGATGGTLSFIAINVKAQRAVIVMGNSANAIVDIGNHLVDADLPLQPPDPQPRRVEKALADPKSFDAFVGTYRMTPAFAIDVTRDGARYFLQATNQPRIEMLPMADNAFFLRTVEAAVTFERDDAGKVTHLILDQNKRLQRANRVAP